MADNVAITAGAGTSVATEDVSGVHHQKVKVEYGPDGAATLVDAGTPLPVTDSALATALASILSVVDGLEGFTDGLEGLLTTVRDKSADVATTLTDGRKTITTAGAAEAIRGTLTCKWVTVTALATNTLDVHVGGSGAIANAGTQTGTPLAARETITLPVDDASKVFIDVLANGEGVTFTVGS